MIDVCGMKCSDMMCRRGEAGVMTCFDIIIYIWVRVLVWVWSWIEYVLSMGYRVLINAIYDI